MSQAPETHETVGLATRCQRIAFERHAAACRRDRCGQTHVRVELLDPLPPALGWDVHSEAGYAEAYKDVVHSLVGMDLDKGRC